MSSSGPRPRTKVILQYARAHPTTAVPEIAARYGLTADTVYDAIRRHEPELTVYRRDVCRKAVEEGREQARERAREQDKLRRKQAREQDKLRRKPEREQRLAAKKARLAAMAKEARAASLQAYIRRLMLFQEAEARREKRLKERLGWQP